MGLCKLLGKICQIRSSFLLGIGMAVVNDCEFMSVKLGKEQKIV